MVHTPEATVLAPIRDLGKARLQVRILPPAQIGLTLIFVKMVVRSNSVAESSIGISDRSVVRIHPAELKQMLIMASNSKIEWTHHTGNLWWGCSKVLAGCDNCYAEGQANRYGRKVWGNDAPRMATKSVWSDFLKWQAAAHAAGEIHRVFVGSMMDIGEKPMPLVNWQGEPAIDASDGSRIYTDALRDRLCNEIVPACPNLDFLFLSKRACNYNKYMPEVWKHSPPDNVMFGTSVSDMKTWCDLVPQLLKVKGRRFLSVEPQIGPLKLLPFVEEKVDWIIQGGESGPHKRPFDISWAYWLRDWWAEHGIPYFFKQLDKVQPIPEDLMVRQFPERK